MEFTVHTFKVTEPLACVSQVQKIESHAAWIILTRPRNCFVHHIFAGPVMGFPVQGVQTVIQHVSLESGTSAAMVSACVSRCMLKVSLLFLYPSDLEKNDDFC